MEFGQLLFSVAREHFDPGHQRLQWSEGFAGTAGPGPLKEWGRKFGRVGVATGAWSSGVS
jgi:hypothetical protein